MSVPAPWYKLRTADELRVLREENAQEFRIDEFTCDDCIYKFECLLAFDPYNTNGDCLLEK